MTFRTWLRARIYDNTPTGELARLVYHDKAFPLEGTKKQYLKYLQRKELPREMVNTFCSAWGRYKTGAIRFGGVDILAGPTGEAAREQ